MNKKLVGILLFVSAVAAFILMDRFLDGLADKDFCTEANAKHMSTIIFTNDGVSPLCSIVQSGQKVIWENKSEKTIQVSSDPHPVHSDNSEISSGKFVLQLEPGKNTSVIMIRRGTFGFHDHIKPSLSGKIIIK